MTIRLMIGTFAAAVALMSAAQAEQRSGSTIMTLAPNVQSVTPLNLAASKSQVIRVNQAIGKIAVGNPEIADAVALTDRSFYVLGKTNGTTNLSVYGQNQELIAVVDVVVGIDVQGIKSALNAVLPQEKVEVRAVNDSVALGGVLSSPAKVQQATAVAQRFIGKDATVINNMSVHGVQQVMLQVKVAEMQRNLTKQLGFRPAFDIRNPNSSTKTPAFPDPFGTGGNQAGFSSATDSFTALSSFAVAAGTAVSGNFAFNYAVDALEQKGAIKILAEPNLVAMSGDTANFLAGGEFPVPTNQTTSNNVPTITVEFKPFGVSLAFTPTVIEDDLINLVVAPEVSQIDKQTAPVIINGFTIPGISTRRARTTVELRDGQSFAIAGLLQSNFSDEIQQIPGIGDIPIIGALARDSQFQRNETELVIIVTPKLVHPVPANTLVAPTDSFAPPSDADVFLNGKVEAPNAPAETAAGGGLTGPHGHIIR